MEIGGRSRTRKHHTYQTNIPKRREIDITAQRGEQCRQRDDPYRAPFFAAGKDVVRLRTRIIFVVVSGRIGKFDEFLLFLLF